MFSVNDYIEDMVTFTTLVKFITLKYFCDIKVAELGEIFYPAIIFGYVAYSATSELQTPWGHVEVSAIGRGPLYYRECTR